MSEPTVERTAEDTIACPTCGAKQARSKECRRCKCDLSLLERCRRAAERERGECLRHLSAGRPEQALRHARRYATLVGAREATPLLGACLLFSADWPDACALAVQSAPPTE